MPCPAPVHVDHPLTDRRRTFKIDPAAGLLDPATNMTYAVRYLAGAYRAAGGNENRAVALYARGYYQEAKAQGITPYGAQALVR